jgi:hypothetical protein
MVLSNRGMAVEPRHIAYTNRSTPLAVFTIAGSAKLLQAIVEGTIPFSTRTTTTASRTEDHDDLLSVDLVMVVSGMAPTPLFTVPDTPVDLAPPSLLVLLLLAPDAAMILSLVYVSIVNRHLSLRSEIVIACISTGR